MKSARKLLVSALASAVLCSPVAHALPVGAMVGIAGGSVAGVATLATIINVACSKKGEKPVEGSYCAESSNLNSQSVPSKEYKIIDAKDVITKALGEGKCEVLLNCKHYFKFDFTESKSEFKGFDDQFLKCVTNLKLTLKGKTEALSDKEAISSFLNNRDTQINNWYSEGVVNDLEGGFEPIAIGFPEWYSVALVSNKDEKEKNFWGNGLIYSDNHHGNSYQIYVSNDYKLVKICYCDNYGTCGFEAIIDVLGNQ